MLAIQSLLSANAVATAVTCIQSCIRNNVLNGVPLSEQESADLLKHAEQINNILPEDMKIDL